MELEVTNQRENHLLSRIEVSFRASHQGEPTPKREAVRDELAKQLKATKDRVMIDHMESGFGQNVTQGYAKVYKTKEAALGLESEHILVRNGLAAKKEKAKKGEAEKEEPKKEAPKAEAKKEAPKAEAKKEAPKAEAKKGA
ncbi:MAG: 30S ribosomal protein S24e [Euryarchaeota archaeon]|nr:30S ribosomal protein S24e [Euryarchaeota archaeon]